MYNKLRMSMCNIRYFEKKQTRDKNSSKSYVPHKSVHFPLVNHLQLRSIPELVFARKQYIEYNTYLRQMTIKETKLWKELKRNNASNINRGTEKLRSREIVNYVGKSTKIFEVSDFSS